MLKLAKTKKVMFEWIQKLDHTIEQCTNAGLLTFGLWNLTGVNLISQFNYRMHRGVLFWHKL